MAGDGWNNPVIGGADVLIRRAMKSPNYVAGVSGWTVNKDGSAEFSDVTMRGSLVISGTDQALLLYEGAPANGTLSVSISASTVEETDAFGNTYPPGFCLHSPNGTTAAMFFLDPVTAAQHASLTLDIFLNTIRLSHDGGGTVELSAAGGDVHVTALGFTVDTPNSGFRFGAGEQGEYYAADLSWSQALTTAVFTQINGFTVAHRNTGYGGQLAAGVFTAPVSGYYDASLYMDSPPAGATAILTCIRRNGANVAITNTPNVGRGTSCAVCAMFLNVNDTVTFHVSQTGVAGNPVCGGLAQIARRL